jgi:epsilon-lactone hydrolase
MRIVTVIGLVAAVSLAPAASAPEETKSEGDRATVNVPAFDLPLSHFLTPQAREKLRKPAESDAARCPSLSDPTNLTVEGVKATRACLTKAQQPSIERMRARFPVDIRAQKIARVPTEIFTPKEGVSPANKSRVLINLHGGGFVVGDARLEAIPIAALGKIEVVGVDYRMGPEHKFPAANEDIAAVYKELLKNYAPADIGIYGCSAGGRLTAQSMVWFQQAGLPLPGAIGMFASGGEFGVEGDSAYVGSAILGYDVRALPYRALYFGKNADPSDPVLSPISAPQALAKFPPALLMSATRDYGMSNIISTHRALVKAGAPADLHIWDGLGHCFFFDLELPESHEAYETIVKFFAAHLGKAAR